jgi:hypothetical protein
MYFRESSTVFDFCEDFVLFLSPRDVRRSSYHLDDLLDRTSTSQIETILVKQSQLNSISRFDRADGIPFSGYFRRSPLGCWKLARRRRFDSDRFSQSIATMYASLM